MVEQEKPIMKVYGQTHSPWVQAVLLGLHDRQIAHELTTATPLALVPTSGVMMPAAQFGDGWQLDSAAILARLGFAEVAANDRRAIAGAWQGVLHRTDSLVRFFGAFSRAGDPHPQPGKRLWRNFWRSFSAFYFAILIRLRVHRAGHGDPEDFVDQFIYWETRLQQLTSPYIGGDEPDTTDLQLFGVVQCHFSIPVPPVPVMLEDPRLGHLRAWLGRMQMRFSDYPYLYSGPWLLPNLPGAFAAKAIDRLAFHAGLGCCLLLSPLTVPLVLVLMRRVHRG